MKKIFLPLLAALLCLLLTACGRTEAVKNIEAQIDSIEEVTLETGDALAAIEAAYEALSEEEKKTVKNYDAFLSHKDSYTELRVVGTWYPVRVDLWQPEDIFAMDWSFTLNADMTCTYQGRESGTSHGEWLVENGTLIASGIRTIDYPSGGSGFPDGLFTLSLREAAGMDTLNHEGWLTFLREDDYLAMMNGIIRVVDCSSEPLNDYFSFTVVEDIGYDEWGVRDGHDYDRVCLKSNLFDEGWYYIGASEDFALEVTYPAYTRTTTYQDGKTETYEMEGESHTITNGNPFGIHEVQLQTRGTFSTGVWESDLDLNDIAISRAKGKMYFLNSEYVAGVEKLDGSHFLRVRHNPAEDEILIFCSDDVWTGEWHDDNQEY